MLCKPIHTLTQLYYHVPVALADCNNHRDNIHWQVLESLSTTNLAQGMPWCKIACMCIMEHVLG